MLNGKKETIEVKSYTIQNYTEDFKNNCIIPADIIKYKTKEKPNVVVANANWMGRKYMIEFLFYSKT